MNHYYYFLFKGDETGDNENKTKQNLKHSPFVKKAGKTVTK